MSGTTEEDEAPEVGTATPEQPTSTPSEKKQQEEPPKDDEGLLLKYDVIVCGTGLVQSILASALTRAGKSVLHCDGNDHYGELDTVWTFDYLQELIQSKTQTTTSNTERSATTSTIDLSEQGSYQTLKFHSTDTKTNFPISSIGTSVKTPYGNGKVIQTRLPTDTQDGHVAIALDKWTMADGSNPTVYIGISMAQLNSMKADTTSEEAMEIFLQQHSDVQSTRSLAARHILQQQSRSLALDVTPQLLYASGTAVQGFLASGVAEHLEFQTMQAVYWLQTDSNNSDNNNKSTALERVPCSKGDVFQSPLLPPLDKRRFMKFFQLAMDYATEREIQQQQQQQQQQQTITEESEAATANSEDNNTEEGVLSLNERQLNQGRSLARPQNKAVSQKDLTTLHDCMDQNMSFDTYLQDRAKLSPQLRQLIRHALAMDITASNDDEYDGGGTSIVSSSLSTREGMGRLCDHLKALGRYGMTAFLTPLYGAGEMSQFFCRSAAVYGATYLLRRSPTQVQLLDEDGAKRVESVTICNNDEETFGGADPAPKEKTIQAMHVVLAKEAKLDAPCSQRLVRRISVLRGNLVPSTTRSVIVIPPHGVGNHKYAIHGLVLDETAKVAPHGCTLLHLTTVVDEKDVMPDDISEDLGCLGHALSVLLKSVGSSSSSEPAVDEIFHVTYSYGIYGSSDKNTEVVQGLHEIGRTPMPLAVDETFEKARRIFYQICDPGLEFLELSLQMQEKLKEQLQDAYRGPNQADDDDAEQHVLDSAMDMMSSS